MSVDRKAPSPVARVEGEKVWVEGQESHRPPPLSRMIQLRHTIAQPVLAAFLAGGVAGAVSRTVVSPLERLKILFQIQSAGRMEYKLPVGQGLMKMWRDEGWRGFMRGNGANCIRIIPYSAVQFSSYNFYKKVSRPSQGKICRCGPIFLYQIHVNQCAKQFAGIQQGVPTAPWKNLLCGGLAGITSVTFTYPLDLVRTRLSVQTADFSGLSEAEKKNMPGMWKIMVNVYKTEGGILALYGGYIPTIAGVAPYVGYAPLQFVVSSADVFRSD